MEYIFSPKQLQAHKFLIEKMDINGLTSKNFRSKNPFGFYLIGFKFFDILEEDI